MADAEFDSRQVKAALRLIDRRLTAEMAVKALNRTAFEILEAEARGAKGVFDFAGGSTQRFLADRGFFFRKATTRETSITVRPKPRAARILREHVVGGTVTAEQGGRLALGDKLAIPVGVTRGRRGRVPKRLRPSEVLQPGRGGFINRRGTALFQRKPGRRARRDPPTLLYLLVDRAPIRPVFRFFDIARRTAARQFPIKVGQEWRKALRKARAQSGG